MVDDEPLALNTPKPDYYRNLPHFTPNDAPYFLTFNLDGALPAEVRTKLLSKERA